MKYNLKTTQLFNISTDELILGNYKYGKIINANKNKLFSLESNLFEIDISRKNIQDIELNSSKYDRLSFYNYYGRFKSNIVSYERNFIFGENAIFTISDILSKKIKINFTEKFRKWTISRLSKMNTIGNYLSDITTLRLLQDNILSFHGAAFEINNKGYVVTGFPDTGKSYTILKLLENNNINFMSEDILLLDKENYILGVPFTQTIEKRKKLNIINSYKSRLYNYVYKDNYIKSDVFEALNLTKSRFTSRCKLNTIFFLLRGKNKIRRLEDSEKNYNILRDLNNLEFSYWRNDLILTYLFFQKDMSIYDFMSIENNMLKYISKNIEIVEVTAESYDKYYDLINKWMQNGN